MTNPSPYSRDESITYEARMELLTIGMDQVPSEGINEFLTHVKSGEPVLMSGKIYDSETEHG